MHISEQWLPDVPMVDSVVKSTVRAGKVLMFYFLSLIFTINCKYQTQNLFYGKKRMGKRAYIALFMFFLLLPAFGSKKDTEANLEFTFKTKLLFNIYGPNYQGYGPTIGKRFSLAKGNKIIAEVSGISDKNISKLYFSIVDRNSASSYWRTLTPSDQLFIEDIKANEPFNCVFEIEVIDNPLSMFTTCFVFMHKDKAVKTVKLTSCNVKVKFKE